MVKHHTFIAVDPEDLRVAKGIASFKGLTLGKYFKHLVDKEAKEFQQEMKSDTPAYRRRNR